MAADGAQSQALRNSGKQALCLSKPLRVSVSSLIKQGINIPILAYFTASHWDQRENAHESYFLLDRTPTRRMDGSDGTSETGSQTIKFSWTTGGQPSRSLTFLPGAKQIQIQGFSSCCPLCLECPSPLAKLLCLSKNPVQTLFGYCLQSKSFHLHCSLGLFAHISHSLFTLHGKEFVTHLEIL